MTQVDLETLVTSCTLGGNDSKITCETLAVTGAGDDLLKDEENDTAEVPSDYPPESFWLSKDAEYDWFDRNAFYERKDSTKGSSNPNNLSSSSNLNSNSQRSNKLKSKALIIGLPKTQKTTYIDSRRRSCKLANARLFPNRSVSAGRSIVAVVEPSSPKVSCMGRVRSRRCRRRNNSSRKNEAQAEKSRTGGEKRKTGFYTKVMGMFRSKKGNKKPIRSGSRKVKEAIVVEPQRKSVSIKLQEIPVSVELVADPPCLEGMKRFSSGRRSHCWTAEELNTAISESLELNRPVRKRGA